MKKECISMVCGFLILAFLCPAVHSDQGIRTGRKLIVLDPGHGGVDTGAVSPAGIAEKDLVLQFSSVLAHILSPDFSVALTRSDDIKTDLLDRTSQANRLQADLFISLHAKPGTTQPNTLTCYIYQPAGSVPRDPGTTDRQWEFNQMPHMKESRFAAESLCAALTRERAAPTCTIISAPMAVLAGAGMPAVLVEPFLLSDLPDSRQEQAALLTETAQAIAGGIHSFFDAR